MSLDQLLTECDPAQAASLATPGVDRALDALGSAIVGEARPARRRPRRLARLWLFGVARNLLLRSARRLRVADALVERLAGELRAAQPPAPTDDRAERLRSALADLSERDREIVTLTAWEGLAPRESHGLSEARRRPCGSASTEPEISSSPASPRPKTPTQLGDLMRQL
jgi:hypothetical protein